MKKLVIIPTYNEKENIEAIVPAIFDVVPNVDILVVDDSSPDGTGAVVETLQKKFPQLHLLVRQKKRGIGQSLYLGLTSGT